jgi:hypothetical protein
MTRIFLRKSRPGPRLRGAGRYRGGAATPSRSCLDERVRQRVSESRVNLGPVGCSGLLAASSSPPEGAARPIRRPDKISAAVRRGRQALDSIPYIVTEALAQNMDDHGSILRSRCDRRVHREIFIRRGGLRQDCARAGSWTKQMEDVPGSARSQEHVISFGAGGVAVSKDHELQGVVCFETLELRL